MVNVTDTTDPYEIITFKLEYKQEAQGPWRSARSLAS